MKWVGNLLIGASLLGLVLLGLMVAEVQPPWASQGKPATAMASETAMLNQAPGIARGERDGVPPLPASAAARPAAIADSQSQPAAEPAELPEEPRLRIERVAIPAIGLDAAVVPAGLVEKDGALTWEIPRQTAGHAEGTAGAGALGNAVLLGHVDSLRSGDVFRELEKVAVGDRVTVRADASAYTYEVVETKTVDRADTAMVQTTQTAALTLFTCTGQWLPTIWDYSHRFVVRAELRASGA